MSETGALSPSTAPEQTVCETGVSQPGLATEQNKSETGVLSPGPSTNATHPEVQRVTAGTIPGTGMSIVTSGRGHDGNRWVYGWNEHYHGDNWTDAWRERSPGYVQQHDDDNSTNVWSKCKSDDEWRASHWETSSWSSSHWETSGWNDADECSNDRKEQLRSSHSFFEAKNMNQLISSLCRGNDVATFSGIEVDPGESLADTAAQSGIIDVRPFRKAEEALFHKFGLKPRVIPGDNQAVGIGGRAKVLGNFEMPSGMGGVNGIVKYTVVDSPGVPPLTPVSLLKQVGAVIDLNSNTMDLKKIETTTTLRTLPSGHVAHKLTEFAPGGWKAPTLEQTDLFQVKTDAFRPVTLPGEIKSRSSKQCVGFSSGFVYTVRNHSYSTSSHHQHHPDLCVDDVMFSDLLSDNQLAQRTSSFECSLASNFDFNAKSAMGKLFTGRRGSVAKTCSAVPGSRYASVVADRAGLVATSFFKNRSKQSALICRSSWSIAPISGLQWMCATENVEDAAPSSIMSTQLHRSPTKKQKPGRKERRKRLPRSAKEPHRLSRVLTPRRKKTSHVQGATANFMSSTPLRD